MLRLVLAVTVVVGLFGQGIEASADARVDWSQYLEKPGDKPPVTHSARAAPVAKAPAKPAKVSKSKRHAKPKKRARKAHK
ncbi:MAG: hypothetical protein ABI467_13740 [Kofleriaceae bacterium]